MKVKITTLGCKVNQYESEAILAMLISEGFTEAEKDEEADVVIVNSCTVTAESDRKVRQTLRRMKKQNPTAVSVLTGCMPQAFPDKMIDFLDADIIIGNKSRKELSSHIMNFLSSRQRIIDITQHESGDEFDKMSIDSFSDRTRAFVKIEDGCNRFCSYCIIPYARGRVRSKPIETVKEEIESLAKNGYKEVVLTGINLSAYGQDFGLDLCDAVDTACSVDGIDRVRLSSLEPERLSEEVIARMKAQPKLCPQFHLSLQSGCDKTLKAMNRHYTADDYRKIVSDLRKAFDNCAITTDIMVGFAGENDEDFENSLDFVKEIGFAKMHVFSYSRRAGTAAYDAPNQLTNKVKEERSKKMLSASNEMQKSFFKAMIDKVEPVLFEREIEKNTYEGFTRNYVPVRVSSSCDIHGQILDVRITNFSDDYCIGSLE